MRSSLIRRVAAAVGIVMALGFLAVPAAQAQYGTFVLCVNLDEQTRTVTLEGDGYEPGTTITFDATQGATTETNLASTTANADTSFTVQFVVPAAFDLTDVVIFTANGFKADGEGETVSTTPLSLSTPEDDLTCVLEVEDETVTPTPTATEEAVVDSETATPTPTETPAVAGELAFTGSSTMPMITIAVGAIALGSLVLFGIRTRSSQS